MTCAGIMELVRGAALAGALIVVAGCQGQPSPGKEDGGTGPDVKPGMGGLTLIFWPQLQHDDDEAGLATAPDGAGLLAADAVLVDSVHLELAAIRVVGDAPTVEASHADLTWTSDDGRCISFGAALPGKYSQVKATVLSYRIEGHAATEEDPMQAFVIDDQPGTGITIAVDIEEAVVDPGSTTIVPVRFDSNDVAAAVSWSDIALDEDGVASVTATSPVVADVRSKMSESLSRSSKDELDCAGGG